MIVNSYLFEGYLYCSTKCWLRSRNEPAAANAYAEWVCAQNRAYRQNSRDRLLAIVPTSERVIAAPITRNLQNGKWRFAVDVLLKSHDLESRLHAMERIPAKGRGKPRQFTPYRFEFSNKIAKEHKLLIAFDAIVLSEALGREVNIGIIVHGEDDDALKVNTTLLVDDVRKCVKEIIVLVSGEPPDLVLNRHCSQCEFETRCRRKAIEKDELSLLSGMSEKERSKLNNRGVFTVTQLAYTFRPRRRPKQLLGRPEKYHHSLRALAVREKRIHLVGTLPAPIVGSLIFFEVEAVPDRDFYYLIGVRIQGEAQSATHSFWADSFEEERTIWSDFLAFISSVEAPILVHYGSFESKFLKTMCSRHGAPPPGSPAAGALSAPLNLLSAIYGVVYFPTYSNGLKENARYLGFDWTDSNANGLQAIVWRHVWEPTTSRKAVASQQTRALDFRCGSFSPLRRRGKWRLESGPHPIAVRSPGEYDFHFVPRGDLSRCSIQATFIGSAPTN